VVVLAIFNVMFNKIKYWQPYVCPQKFFLEILPGYEIQMSGAAEING
jgi:hypothetical protein